ncbi:MAG: 30S ribosomal protein S8 [Myxococcaceae bacterium]|nr:30S ribosomal protein S8 [Myxococcaceae bacterium]MBH2006959.1 30S ribosomal protein S8 [Myxococcaceae bacterium]
MMTDPISDLLARIRNALMVRKTDVRLRPSRMGESILGILKARGFITDFAQEDQNLVVKLKYDEDGAPVIEGLQRVSKPGLRVYTGKSEIPSVRGGLGISIVSTSRGVMTGSDARKQGVGGEVICTVW